MSITIILLIITGLVSYLAFNNGELLNKLKHYPLIEARSKEYYRWLTSGFVHANVTHLAVNLFVFYSFGEYVEDHFLMWFGETGGRIKYLLFYLLAIVFADIPTYLRHRNNPSFSSVGASGAVSAIIFAFILINPWATLLLFFVIPCPAILAGVGFLVYSSYASKNDTRGIFGAKIDHEAHFYGALFGILYLIAMRPAIANEFIQELISIF